MRRRAATLVAFIVALLAAFGALVIVFPFGLILHEAVIYPLALCIAAVFAALGAAWVATILPSGRASGRDRTRLLSVAGVTVGGAALLAVALLLFLGWAAGQRPAVYALSPIQVAVAASVLFALIAAFASQRLRTEARTTGRDVLATVALLAVCVLAVPGAIVLAAQFGLAGA